MRFFHALVCCSLLASGCDILNNEQPLCDDPRLDCNPDSGYRQEGQTLAIYRELSLANRPDAAVAINLPNVIVSAVDNYLEGPRGTTGNTWIQERILDPTFTGCVPDPVGGGHVCGIELYNPITIPSGAHVIPGDIVNVTGGTYDEFTCPTCSAVFPCCGTPPGCETLPELDVSDMTQLGSTVAPTPIAVSIHDLDTAGLNCNANTVAHDNAYTGVLVRITDIVSTQSLDANGNIAIDTYPQPYGSSVAMSNSDWSAHRPVDGHHAPLRGRLLCNIVGVVSYFYNPEVMVANTNYSIITVTPGVMPVCPPWNQ